MLVYSSDFHVTYSSVDRMKREAEPERGQKERNKGCFCPTHQPSRCLCGNKRASRFHLLAGGRWTETGHWSWVFSCWMELLRGDPHINTFIPPLSLSHTHLLRLNLSHLILWWAAQELMSKAVIVLQWKNLRSDPVWTPDGCSHKTLFSLWMKSDSHY